MGFQGHEAHENVIVIDVVAHIFNPKCFKGRKIRRIMKMVIRKDHVSLNYIVRFCIKYKYIKTQRGRKEGKERKEGRRKERK